MSIISNMVYDLTQYVKRFTGTAAPSTTPDRAGSLHFDTSAKKTYASYGTSSSSDWVEVGTNETGATIKTKLEALTGTDRLSADAVKDGTTNKAYTATEQSKLSGIAAEAIATLETTDATPTDLLSIAAGAATSSSTIEGLIQGLTSDGAIKYCMKFICDYDADGVNGSPFGNVIKKGTTSTMDVAFSISSSKLKITVTGIAATTIHWKLSYRTTVKAY